ncbi:Ctr copper transporter protein [Rutstroemia sp. NJR-2017a BBW]|nr:Ctr copper transporter protein [Rutstroemia sp. NJR-2017a BBW]
MSMSGMTMSMSGSPTTTTSAMSMTSSTDSSMSMSSSGTTLMSMDSMAMTFFTSTTTPLFSMTWTPTSIGQYAGTCIFLIAFAAVFRALLAVRVNFFEVLALVKQRSNAGLLYTHTTDDDSKVRPWRVNEAVILSSMDVLLTAIGYLLMIAVMTMNIGYFISVLAGVFLGSLVFNRFMGHSAVH